MITDENKIEMCKCCTLAEAMKDCQKCAFQIGLPFRLLWLAEKEQEKTLIQHLAEIKESLTIEA